MGVADWLGCHHRGVNKGENSPCVLSLPRCVRATGPVES